MARTFSRLIIVQTVLICLLPLSAWAKLSSCHALLLPDQKSAEVPSYVVGRIRIVNNEKNKPMGVLAASLDNQGLEDESKDSSLLWLIRGTANVDTLPRAKDIGDGDIELAFPVELEDGRTFKVTFLYEPSNQPNTPRFGVLKKIEVLDEVSTKVKVRPEHKDPAELEDLIYQISHGPRGKIYGLQIGETIVPFKSHITPEEIDEYKKFFKVFFKYQDYFSWRGPGILRKPDDLEKVGSLTDLEELTTKLQRDNKWQWYWDRLHKNLTSRALSLIMIGSVFAAPYIHNAFNAPKEYVVNELVSDKYGEVKLYTSTTGTINQFKLSGDDDVRLRNESSLILKDKSGTEFVFSIQRSAGKNKIRLQLLSAKAPKAELVDATAVKKPGKHEEE
jgi:hypothetical protein